MQYQEGQQLQGSDGKIYVVQGGVPREAGGAQPSAPQAQPGATVIGTPRPKMPSPQTPDQAQSDALTVTNKQYQAQSQPIYDRSNAIDKARDGYRQDKRVLKYEQALPIYISGLQSAGDPAGDLLLINAFSKVNDPDTGVQQREGDQAAAAQPATAQMKAQLLKQFGSDGYGNFTPEGRAKMRDAMKLRMEQLATQYRQARNEQRQYIQSLNLPDTDAETIIGPFAGHPFQKEESAYIQSRGGTPRMANGEPWPGADPLANDAQRNPDGSLLIDPSAGQGGIDVDIEGGPNAGRPPSPEEVAANPKLYAEWYRAQQQPGLGGSFAAGVGDLVEGAGDTLGLIANPLNAGINWATGSNLSTDLGQTFRDASGLPEGDPLAGAINRGASTALTGVGLARGVASLAPNVARYAAPLTAEPIRQGVAGGGAGAGAEIARQNNLGPLGEGAAALAGGFGGYAGANSLLRLARPKTASPLMRAAQEQNVRLRPADVGGATTRRLDSAAAQSAFSASSVGRAAERTQADMGAAVRRTASREGDILPEDEAGEALIGPLKGYSQKQASRIGRVYDRAEDRAKGVKIKPQQSLAFLDEQIARFKSAPQGESIAAELQSVRDSIANGVSVAGMRDARTILSQGVHDGKLRSGLNKGIYKQFLGLLSKDIDAGLSASGRKDALNLFRIADKAWSERIEYIDNVLEPVLGRNKSGEQVLSAIESMAKGKGGGVRRLNELLRELPTEQAGNIRATVIDRMGRATAGNQDAAGDVFSANTFLTNWNRMSGKGKAAMFGDAELRRNLDQIAKLAEATAETGRFANSSNTGGALNNNLIAMGAATGVSELATGQGLATFGALAGAQLLTGKLLASSRFAAWLAKAPKVPAQRHEGQLAQIAAREPIIANDIASIQRFLGEQSYRAAASPEEQN